MILMPLALAGLLMTAASFGIFYAWVCTTMWGLDAADPRVAIPAMQEMNLWVRNGVFAVPFFGAGPVLLGVAALAARAGQGAAAGWFGAGGLAVLGGVTLLTMIVLVPRNEAFAQLSVPEDIEAARAIWLAYSPSWQVWNGVRTAFGGIGVLCAGLGLMALARGV